MRIIIAGPPRTGNTWSKCLLSETYGLQVLHNEPKSEAELKRRLARGWYRENTIFHQHLWPTDGFFEAIRPFPSHIVTCLRNPYDTFVSLYFFVQNAPHRFRANRALRDLVAKPIDHPDVLAYIRRVERGFGANLRLGLAWASSQRSLILKYEDLHANPGEVLGSLAADIAPVDPVVARRSVESCDFKKMHAKRRRSLRGLIFGQRYADHLRKGAVGDWRNHLTADHFEAFLCHQGLIRKLGYEVITNRR